MPGVPSGLGCDACRKQKKKCDRALPACARCAQLKINCSGAGRQRYKFIHYIGSQGAPLRILPSSKTTLIAGQLISRLEVKDVRYDTGCFGAFLQFIPQRIGANSALDIAADTFATLYSNLSVDHCPVQALVKHGQSLTALRDSLKLPPTAEVAEIASAIYLTMLNDDMLSRRPKRPRACHFEILVYLLQMTDPWAWKTQFELEAFLTITGVVVMESVGNPRIRLEPWVWKVLERIEGPNMTGSAPLNIEAARRDSARFPSLDLRRIVEMAQLIREPAHRCLDLQWYYELLLSDREKLKHQPKSLFYNSGSLLVNLVLQEISALDASLPAEADVLIEEIIVVSQIPDRFKPLGACYVTHCLIVACAAARDLQQQTIITSLLNELSDFEDAHAPSWPDGLHGWRRRWEYLRQRVSSRPLLSAAICRFAGGQ